MILVLAAIAAVLLVATAAAQVSHKTLRADMTGEEVVPGPGNEDAFAEATIERTKKDKICFEIDTFGVGEVHKVHIHKGKRGERGVAVVTLFKGEETGDEIDGCVKNLEPKKLKVIYDGPFKYYVDTHTTDFQGGAVRGQLEKFPQNP